MRVPELTETIHQIAQKHLSTQTEKSPEQLWPFGRQSLPTSKSYKLGKHQEQHT
jgi:hypothetical protein